MRFWWMLSSLMLGAVPFVQAQAAKEPKPPPPPPPTVVVAEGEVFKPQDDQGWKAVAQDDSYAAHTYGGMWSSMGGLLGAPAASVGSVATRTVQIPEAGEYRLWSKYQAPPYFNYLHELEVVQQGKVVLKHTFGKNGTDRLWSFSTDTDELWWFWGVDHDCAEPAPTPAKLAAGPAELRLRTVANPAPAGDRFIDFVVLTTSPERGYHGYKPYGVGSPFTHEAFAAYRFYARFQNTGTTPAQLAVSRAGHYQPAYGGANAKYPAAPVPPGEWSAWFNLGPFLRLVHNEGLWLKCGDATQFPVQFARDEAGKDLAGDCKVTAGEAVNVPLDIMWNPAATVEPSRAIAARIVEQSKTWRHANGGKKPQQIAYFGAFGNAGPWVYELKSALGYNTGLPDQFGHLAVDGYHQHAHSEAEIRKYAEGKDAAARARMRVLSFGDEIHIGATVYLEGKLRGEFEKWVNPPAPDAGKPDAAGGAAKPAVALRPLTAALFQQWRKEKETALKAVIADAATKPAEKTAAEKDLQGFTRYDELRAQFIAWLKQQKVGQAELGVAPDAVEPAVAAQAPRVAWYAKLFGDELKYADYRRMTTVAKELFGPQLQTGANYSPHNLILYYGPLSQWVDIFRHDGMTMYWSEDYIFSVPEPPQILSWHFAMMQCAVRPKGQMIHYYVMPHAPGQTPDNLRRSMIFAVGNGARHIDSFWVAPQENFTENFVAWNYPETFRAITESIFDTAEAENYLVGGKVRSGRVALLLSRATEVNEGAVRVPKANDPFASHSKNAPATIQQTIGRKEQQMLYLALRHAQQTVDLVADDDVAAGGALKNYDVLYVAGGWMDTRVVAAIKAWVEAGGVLYASGGLGLRNQFNEDDSGMLAVLGLKAAPSEQKLNYFRTYLELPLVTPVDTLKLGEDAIPAVGLKQKLEPAAAKVLGTWSDGSAAVTVNALGKGQAFAVGTLAGASRMKTALRVQPWARGGRHTVYHPTDFLPAADRLARLAVEVKPPASPVVCSVPGVEGAVIDGPTGSVVTLVNWTNGPAKAVQVAVRLPAAPKGARSVVRQQNLTPQFADGVATFSLDLAEADYVLLPK